MAAPESFDADIERLFSRPPAFSDAAEFEARIEQRLKRGSRLRTGLLTAGGAIGGLLAVREALEAGLAGDLTRVSEESSASVEAISGAGAWSRLMDALTSADLSAVPSMPLFWLLSAALVGLAALTMVKAVDPG